MSRDGPLAPRVEHVRLAWEYAVKEAELHQQRLVQLFAILVTAGLTALASAALEKVPAIPAIAFAVATFLAAAYVHLLIRRLPRKLQGALLTGQRGMEKLMGNGGR